MAFFSNKSISLILLSLFISICLMFLHGNCTEFIVGESNGWGVPQKNEPNTYNLWAEKKRFKTNDTLEFKYKKDSVMEVNEAEYDQCKTSEPLFFANKGDTTIALNRSGLFYFISGVTGHCERGQKMVVKVLDVNVPTAPGQPSPPADEGGDKKKKNGATQLKFMGVSSMVLIVVGFIFMG